MFKKRHTIKLSRVSTFPVVSLISKRLKFIPATLKNARLYNAPKTASGNTFPINSHFKRHFQPHFLKVVLLILVSFTFCAILSTILFLLLNRTITKPVTFPPNTVIVKDIGTYSYKNVTNEFSTHFKNKPTDSGSIVFSNNLGKISFYTLKTQSFGELNTFNQPVANGSTLTYPNIFPQMDLRYTISPSRLLEEFVINDKSTANLVTKIDQIAKTNQKYQKNADGSLTFTDTKNHTVFSIPAPVLYELHDKTRTSNGIKYEVQTKGNQLTISKVLTPEGVAWLNDKNRVYPVVIDLVIDNADTSTDWVSSDPTNTVVSQETTIKEEGSSSVKVKTTSQSSIAIDLMEYSTNGSAQTAYTTNALSATGGTITYSGTDIIHTFTTSGTLAVTNSGNVQVLVVGGGGGGNSYYAINYAGGGGGAGGAVYNSSFAISAGNITATVGGGGAVATNGDNSVFSSITGTGGGAGGRNGNGAAGGCGGGAGSQVHTGGTGSQGYNGGNSVTSYYGGAGGGGMGSAGVNTYATAHGTNGGTGVTYSISGSSVCYAGGGGGGAQRNLYGEPGTGQCGGGNGGGGAASSVPTAGADNRGSGGGGGAGYNASYGIGAAGGSGIIIVRYPYNTLQSYSESSIKTQGSYSLKGFAQATSSLNQTLTRTIGSPADLSNSNTVTFDIRSTRTGSNIKVGLHDSGGTTTEITPNITSANTFQTATIDLSGVSTADKDAIDQIIITVVNADADNTFYIDNFIGIYGSLDDTVTLTKTATNISSYNNLTFWVRSDHTGSFARFQFGEIASDEQTYDITINSADTWEKKTWTISGISSADRDAVTQFAFQFTSDTSGATFYFDDIVANSPPNAPTISSSYLHDKLKTANTTPQIQFSATDPESDDIVYQISWDTTSAFTGATTKSSDTDAGFADITNPADTSPFASEDTVSYTFQSALSNGTTYYYRTRAIDPSGSNLYSGWSTTRSFTIDTSLTTNRWFETMADQFATDTYTGNATSSAVTDAVTVSVTPSNVDLMEYSSNSSAQSAYLASEITGTGGTISNVGVYKVHSFTTDGTFTPAFVGNVEALVVAGGGAGGVGTNSGGGGGGGLIYDSSHAVTATGYSITVGNGGQTASANGGNSVFNTLSAIGGGGGGSPGGTGKDGGSGGGGSANGTGLAGGSGTTGQGNAGGAGSGWYAGGGGGAGGVGTSAGSGTGGAGLNYSVSGTSVTYSVGGTSSSLSPNGAGTANTGMGGGGSQTSANFQGGSGIVVVRYVRNALQSFSESTIKTQGSYSLKGIASASASLNQNLISTPSSAINLSGSSSISFDLRSTRTGSNIKISIHDSGGTTSEITPNILSANAFQTVTWDISGVANANKDAIDQIIITIVNADADNTFYIDNFTATPFATGTITSTPITIANIDTNAVWNALEFTDEAGTDITYQIYYDVTGVPTIIPDSALPGNSTGFTSSPVSLIGLNPTTYPILYVKSNLSDSAGAPSLYDWGVTLNVPPNTPTLDFPADTATHVTRLAVLKTTATDTESDSLKYKIIICTDAAMSIGCKTFDQTVSATGWTAASYASGVQGVYTLQTPLDPHTDYYWRSYAIDPAGSNNWSSTQTTPYSFTTSEIPNIPTLDFPSDTATSVPLIATIKTTATDNDGDDIKYKIKICTDPGMTTNCQTYDQTVSATGWSAVSYASGVQGVYTIQTALNLGTVYYWKSYAIDPAGSNTWSSTQTTPYSFTTNQAPNVVTQDAPANSATEITLTTIFQITTTDVDSDYLRYKIHLCTNVFMTVNCQTFDQTSSQTGWTSQNAESSTAYTSGTQATYTVQTNLVPGTLYYWRAYAIDPAGTNTWSTAQSSPQTFTTKGNPSAPTSCTTVKASDNSSITINWTENATNEDNYQIWSSVNGDLATLVETLSADTAQYVDSPISSNNTYIYLIRALRFDGANTLYSSWCTTSPSNTSTGSLYFDSLKMEGVKIN
ncbi:MAG TPA: hypothetical protein PLI45_04805 [Candidatus Woesebacteria bacterium]|nr:hypothetical protein [Candidatus Woesebacteria bacterium]